MAIDLSPQVCDITLVRGDQFVVTVNVENLDITGATAALAANRSQNPTDISNQIFVIAGVVSDGPAGVLLFPFTTFETSQIPATYYYDMQLNYDSNIRTIFKGKLIIRQDITK